MPLPSAANTAPRSSATSGSISASGFDSAKMICPGRTHSGLISPRTPVVATTMSARAMTSASVNGLATQRPEALARLRPQVGADHLLHALRAQQPRDAETGRPQPDLADHQALDSVRPTRLVALTRAASATTAVPCWSSCSTGIGQSPHQLGLDREALGRRDVLELDGAERRRDRHDRLDDARRVVSNRSGSARP